MMAQTRQIDYGARQYDPAIARWNRTDPMAENFYILSTYHYCCNNPIIHIDLYGCATGDYYSLEGKWLGSDGKKDDKVYVASDVEKNEKDIVVSSINSKELPFTHSKFRRMAATVYGESSAFKENKMTTELKKEMFAIASVHHNHPKDFHLYQLLFVAS